MYVYVCTKCEKCLDCLEIRRLGRSYGFLDSAVRRQSGRAGILHQKWGRQASETCRNDAALK